ncbi:MAG: hypothetical protein AAB874_01505, partial [Patescibacteria group bacterium]
MVKLGKVFIDAIHIEKRRFALRSVSMVGWGIRFTILSGILLTSLVVLLTRVFHLTIIQGKDNYILAQENRIRSVVLHPPRGIIYDRRGSELVTNTPVWRRIGSCSSENCLSKYVDAADLTALRETESGLYEPDFLRNYKYPYQGAHVLGTVGEITQEEITNPYFAYQRYLLGDRTGRSGIEFAFEKDLRGVSGKELVEVDAKGKRIRTLGKVDPVPGNNLTLALDADLQKVAYDALGEYLGAVVVSKPKTGEILALVSAPSFGANEM